MADYIIDINSLQNQKGKFDSLTNSINTLYSNFESSFSKFKSGEIAGMVTKINTPMTRLKNGYKNCGTWFGNYLSEMNSLESSLAAFSGNITAPTEFKGEFIDMFGRVTMSVLKTNGDKLANYKVFGGGTVDPTGQGNGVIDKSVLGGEFSIVNTKADFMDYYTNVIANKSLYQSANLKRYSDQCLGFAYNYAWGLYTDNRNINGSTCRNDTSFGNNFKRFTTNNEEEYKQKLYNELKAGRPVVVQVIGSRSRRSRHYVTAVGFNKNVKSSSDLKLTDIVIVDSYDGQVKRTTSKGSSSGRYIAKGTDINSGRYPYGYELYSIRT